MYSTYIEEEVEETAKLLKQQDGRLIVNDEAQLILISAEDEGSLERIREAINKRQTNGSNMLQHKKRHFTT